MYFLTYDLLLLSVGRYSDYTIARKLLVGRADIVQADYAQDQLHSIRTPIESV